MTWNWKDVHGDREQFERLVAHGADPFQAALAIGDHPVDARQRVRDWNAQAYADCWWYVLSREQTEVAKAARAQRKREQAESGATWLALLPRTA